MPSDEGSLNRIGYSRGIGPREAVARGLGVVLVALVFPLLGQASSAVGALAPTALLLAGLLVAVNGLGYSELSLRVNRSGGAYTLVRSARGGGWLAFLTGWAVALSGLGLCALLTQAAAQQVALLLSDWLESPPLGGLLAMAMAVVAVLGAGVLAPIRRRLSFFLPLAFLVVVVLVVVGIPRLPAIDEIPARSDHGPTVALLLAAFVGMEAIANHQSEIRRRVTNVPRLLLFVPIAAAALAAVLVGLLGSHSASVEGSPLVPLGEAAAGDAGRAAVLVLSFFVLLISLRRATTMVVHNLFVMGRDGLLPEWLQHVQPRRRVPARLGLLVGLLVLPLVWIPAASLSAISGLLYLAALMAVNLALVLQPGRPGASGETPDARRGFRLPFHPWVPALVLAVDFLAVLVAGPGPLLGAVALLGLGGLVYVVYGRGQRIEAQEGITVFRPEGEEPSAAGFRVLVPIADPESAGKLLGIAGDLAVARGGDVVALHVVTVPEPVPLEAGRWRAGTERDRLEAAVGEAQAAGLPVHALTRVARNVSRGIVDAALDEGADLIVLGWRAERRARLVSPGPIVDAVMQDAPCDVVALRREGPRRVRSLLVPTAGGPHARSAARLALQLTEAWQAQVTLLYVHPGPASEAGMAESRSRLAATVEGLEGADRVEQKVISAPDVLEELVAEAKKHDLVLVGVSREGLFDRIVFGSLPLQLASRVPAVALVQGYQGLAGIWMRRVLRVVQGWLPALSRDEQLDVRQMLARDSRPGVDYFVLIVLSCVIASLGLLMDSPALVIGAMLVAPLMSPVLGFALGLVEGDLRLLRLSVEAVFKGATLAALVAAFVGVLSPLKIVTPEMLAQSRPNLLDMAVALASGMAGAYAVARKDVSAALPGVAIAATLTPALATMGVGASGGDFRVAAGALLLFVTNIAAIVLAAGLVFLVLGMRPGSWGEESKRQLRQRLIAILLALLVVAVPLALIMVGVVRDAGLEREARDVLSRELSGIDGELVAVEIERQDGYVLVAATARAAGTPSQDEVDRLAAVVSEELDRTVWLEMAILPIVRSAPMEAP